MKNYNPVKEGLKKYGSAHAYFLTLKEKAATEGMTAMEWDWYSARQNEWEPNVLAAERTAAHHKNAMDRARTLSIEDLQSILAEKQK